MMRTKTGIVCVLAALTVGACSWGNGSSSNPSPDAAPVMCGDGVCAASEVNSCASDCGNGGGNQAVCGNGQCETTKGESATSCPMDCGGGGSNVNAVCGNGQCEAGETSTSCPSDCTGGTGSGALNCSDPNTTIGCGLCTVAMICTPPYDAVSCAACGGGLGSGLSLCTGGAPDNTCDAMEDNTTCPEDCP